MKKHIFIIVMAVICLGICSFGRERSISNTATAFAADNQYKTDNPDAPAVYMTTEITPEALVKIYERLGFNAEGNVAVKMSTGEPPASNYLRPELIKDLVQKVDGTIVECNTAYGGSRSSTAMHKQVAADHGFTAIANVDIMDEDDSITIPVPAPASGESTITENYVGSHLKNYDSIICLSHFKGHSMAGYGGAIKNMSIGVASSKGKGWIHSGGTSMTNIWGGKQDAFLEAMGDATSSVIDYMDNKVVYINVMNRLSVDCDCDGNPAEPDMHDIGILASTDPVAVDQACIDLIYAQKDGDGKSLVQRIESRNGLHTLEHAAQIGIGSREYRLVDIDNEPSPSPTVEPTPRPQANMTYAGGALTISNLVGDAKLIHASYTNGTLSGLEITDAKNSTTNVETRSGDKFMLWSAIGEMIPISPAITVETGTITEPEPTPTPTPEPEKSKTLVAYFSWTNHTEEIANYITEITDADKYEIIPKEPYGPENNNYYDQSTRAYQEQYDDTARPEIDGTVSNMEQYDIVFVGYPIWYGKAPKIIYTFLEQYDFAGKTVIPFCTSASSGIGSTSELQRLTHDANWLDGKRFNIGESKDSVTAWVNGLGLDFGDNEEVDGMVLINGGTFRMGSPEGEAERDTDEVLHSVTVDSFYIDDKELTQSEYQAVMGSNPSEQGGDNLPVENVTWYDAIEYCNKRSLAEVLTPCYTVFGDTVTWDKSANGYRLPTEAEWEYAARANTDTPFSFGSYVYDENANCYNAYGYNNNSSGNWVNGYLSHTVVVDSYDANSYGLYNMHGNVGEWVWDWYGEYPGDAVNPTGSELGHYKVVRGGGWNDFPKHIRSAYRSAYPADAPLYSIGIRVARNAAAGSGSVKSVNAAKPNEKANKTLIAYFSQTGNTDGLAKIIEEISGADIFRIERATPYSATSNSQTLYAEALNEQRENAIPDLKMYLEDAGLNINDYDTILLGYCNWWASIPAPVRSFLTHYDMSGKTIIPFCSMGGGRFGQTISAVAKLCPDSAIKEGLDVTYASYNRDEITAWLKASGVME